MKKLELQFVKNGFTYTSITRDGEIAIYEQKQGSSKWYEVFIIQQNKERIIAGKTIEAGESMPGSEQWGSKGWTFYDLRQAIDKAIELRQAADRRKNDLAQQ